MSIYKYLKKLKLVSWPTLLIGYEKGLILKRDIEDYAVLLLCQPNFFEQNTALLANASNYDDNEIKDLILKQLDLKTFVREVEIDKLKLAALLFIEKSVITDDDKCNKLQELYADFNYPEDMTECSIYSINTSISPLKAMHKLITTLKKKYKSNYKI